jgi:hypothetical protein
MELIYYKNNSFRGTFEKEFHEELGGSSLMPMSSLSSPYLENVLLCVEKRKNLFYLFVNVALQRIRLYFRPDKKIYRCTG